MHRFTYAALTCCLVFLAPSITHAVTLQYTGNPFTITDLGAGNITATVDFLTPLTNGATLGPADVNAFTITGPVGTMDTGAATFTALEFIIGPSLTPTMWSMAVEQNLTAGAAVEEYITHLGPTSVFGAFQQDSYTQDDPSQNAAATGAVSSSFILSLPGSWTIVPEPTALSLGIFGAAAFAGLVCGRRKRIA